MQAVCGCNNKKAQVDGKIQYKIRLGAFRNYMNAEELQFKLRYQGIITEINRGETYYTVQMEGITSLEEAIAIEQFLRRKGYDTLLLS